jgi:hypothetical protein
MPALKYKTESTYCAHPDCRNRVPFAPQTYESHRLMRSVGYENTHEHQGERKVLYFCRPAEELELAEGLLRQDLAGQPERLRVILEYLEDSHKYDKDCYQRMRGFHQSVEFVQDLLRQKKAGFENEKDETYVEGTLSRQRAFLVEACVEVMEQHKDQGGIDPIGRVTSVWRRLKYEAFKSKKALEAPQEPLFNPLVIVR